MKSHFLHFVLFVLVFFFGGGGERGGWCRAFTRSIVRFVAIYTLHNLHVRKSKTALGVTFSAFCFILIFYLIYYNFFFLGGGGGGVTGGELPVGRFASILTLHIQLKGKSKLHLESHFVIFVFIGLLSYLHISLFYLLKT